jgi:ATP-dependent RNA helicase RhlE
VRQILRRLPAKRQTLFFSATMPKPIVTLANEMLHDPVSIGIAREPHAVKLLSQQLYPVPAELKSALVVGLLESNVVSRAIVFTRTKHRANRLADYLVKRGIATERIHGNRSQAQRTQALDGFKAGRYRVLVATDIAARGIDIAALGHVVNFDVPLAPEDYVHRIGRTARAERSGAALTLVAPDEEQLIRAIERTTGSRIERVTLEGFDYKNVPAERLEIPLAQRLATMRANRRPKSAAPRRRDSDRRFSPS